MPATAASGAFTLPEDGQRYLGLRWREEEVALPDVPEKSTALVYFAAKVTLERGRRLYARADGVLELWVNGAPQPGDVYRSGKLRVPLAAVPGENLIVVQALGREPRAQLELFTTTRELLLNDADVTAPQLVPGATNAQWFGIQSLSLVDHALTNVSLRVKESEVLAATEHKVPGLAPFAATQLAFELRPKAAWPEAGPVRAELEVTSPDLVHPQTLAVDLEVAAPGARYRHTRLSGVDGSVQYHAVLPPTEEQGEQGLILSLHGAAVEATGQADAYAKKSWAWLVAPTNRRPYGFDWEEWGRLDGAEALDEALRTLPIDRTRVHLTGHSMGGHGTWHFGTLFPLRFGVVGPSAGWISLERFDPQSFQPEVVGRARTASRTVRYKQNLARNTVYAIHGTADDNVPVTETTFMLGELRGIVEDLDSHLEQGAGHWWDTGMFPETGADCVDWPELMARMEERRIEPVPLDFEVIVAAPWINGRQSYVRVESVEDVLEDVVLASRRDGTRVELVTTNARSLTLDGTALQAAGITEVVVNGRTVSVAAGDLTWGEASGKTAAVSGPVNQLFHRPFCLVWEDDGPAEYRRAAALLLTAWSFQGNGHGCGLPRSAITEEVRRERNLVWLGVLPENTGGETILGWDGERVQVAGGRRQAAGVWVFPSEGRLHGMLVAPRGEESLLYAWRPFSSRDGLPDYFLWTDEGGVGLGFFDSSWNQDPGSSLP